MDNEHQEEYIEITIDRNFIANALTAALQMDTQLDLKDYLTVEHLELDGSLINIIAKRNTLIVN